MTEQDSTTPSTNFPATFSIDYPEKSNRLTSFFRLILSIPILFIFAILIHNSTFGNLPFVLFIVTALMMVFRKKYPKWWFDFRIEVLRFGCRVAAYLFLLTDLYPSVDETQSIHIKIDYPDVSKLSRWAPLYKWILSIPHYICLIALGLIAVIATLYVWIHILITARYPKPIFEFIVGVFRWSIRVSAYSSILVTDDYPPFSLK